MNEYINSGEHERDYSRFQRVGECERECNRTRFMVSTGIYAKVE